jgi:peptide/nickel transport system permease protein
MNEQTSAPMSGARRELVLTLKRLRRNKGATLGVAILLIVSIAAIFSSYITPHDPTFRDIARRLKPPMYQQDGQTFLLGTDAVGRDIFSRIIYGTRITLIVGLASVFFAGSIGVLIGLLAGYLGGWFDSLAMRIADVQLAIPFMVLAIAVAAVLGNSLTNTIIVLGITGWVTYGRLVRSETLSVRRNEYVTAAEASGAQPARIIFRHILPNVGATIIVAATQMVARMLLAEASLSFLGLGIPFTTPTWGVMIAEGRDYLTTSWWVSTFPGLAIVLTVMSANLVGDWLRDVSDPRQQLARLV